MNTEREELAKIIWDGAVADRVKDGKDPERVPVVRPKVEALADAILAAGYRKPQQVTTEEELDALPPGSVVLSLSYLGQPSGLRISFQRWADGDWHRGARSGSTHPDNFLPATVLHVGGGGQ